MAKTFKDHTIIIYGNDGEIVAQRTYSVEYGWFERTLDFVFKGIFTVYGTAVAVIALALAISTRLYYG